LSVVDEQKLRAQLAGSEAGPMDLAKAARLLTDIEAVAGQADLSGLKVVDEDRPFITAAGLRVREQAQAGRSLFPQQSYPRCFILCVCFLSGFFPGLYVFFLYLFI
jgi:hypothetical protein